MNILVVDDEDMIREGVAAFLREEGYHVILAKDGQEALEKFHEFPIHLMVLDLMLPKRSGFEVLKEINGNHDIPVIVLSALGDEETQMQVFAFLFSYFYTKRLLEPLFYISKVTGKMQELDHDIRFDETRKDEVGEVGKQINDVYENLLTVIDESERRNERIVRLQKQKVSFVRGASHELKTPLASLRIILENMQYNIGDYKDHPKYIAKSIDQIDQMSHLLEEVLESSKFQEWTECSETLIVQTILTDVLSRYQELARSRGIEIENQLTDATRVVMSLKALDKVLINLISNAIKYSNKNGRVILSEQDGYLSIKNTCQPLNQEELNHLFDIFYHSQVVTDKSEGSGLGLYIVNNILESYQMSYSFLPYEQGMVFKICLQAD